jgi:hypothetical protein
MRFLATLLLIAAPLLAQEPSEEERRAEEARTQEQRADAEEMRLSRLLDELRSKSEAERERAMEELKRAEVSLDKLLPLVAEAMEKAERARAELGKFRIAGASTLQLGTEAISGTADGTEYTLKSLGDGKYELNATKRAEDGRVMEKFVDNGTLKELQQEYAFLRGGLTIQVPPAHLPLQTERYRIETFGRAVPTIQYYDQTWNGGGRVGVNVTPPPEELRFHLQLPEGAGFIVQQVVPGSRADQIGIRRMDILLKLDGELIDSPIQLKRLHEKTGVLEIIRRAETKRIDLATIAEEKPAAVPAEKVVEEPAPAPSGAK